MRPLSMALHHKALYTIEPPEYWLEVQTMFNLADDVYRGPDTKSKVANWVGLVDSANPLFKDFWLQKKVEIDNKNNKNEHFNIPKHSPKDFFACLYRKSTSLTVAYRGTVPKDFGNLWADAVLTVNDFSDYDIAAILFYEFIIQRWIPLQNLHFKPPKLTGHSLGGYLAEVVVKYFSKYIPNLEATVFNAPGAKDLNIPNFEHLKDYYKLHSLNHRVVNYVIDHDKVHLVGQQYGDIYILHDTDSDCSKFMTEYENLSDRVEMFINYPGKGLPYYVECGFVNEHLCAELKREISKKVAESLGAFV